MPAKSKSKAQKRSSRDIKVEDLVPRGVGRQRRI